MESYNSRIMKKPKLGFFGIFIESVKIPFRSPKFIIFTFLASIPLFCAMLSHEFALQQTLIPLAETLSTPPPPICYNFGRSICHHVKRGPLDYIKIAYQQVSLTYLFPGLLYLGIVLFLDLVNTVFVVYFASTIYICSSDRDGGQGLTFEAALKEIGMRGPLVTSAYVLLLASLTLIGVASMAGQCFLTGGFLGLSVMFGFVAGAMAAKYWEWSGVWNMGIVMSIVEKEKHGIVAIGVSGYLSRGCRRRGLLLALVFVAWRMCLRVWSLYLVLRRQEVVVDGGFGDVLAVNGVQIGLACVGNVMKWVVFVVYFYDCKKRFLEKKVDDAEDGRAVAADNDDAK